MTSTVRVNMKAGALTVDKSTAQVWELVTCKLGADRGAAIRFYADKGEAEHAKAQAHEAGFATRLQAITVPTDGKALARLLSDYVSMLGVRG